MKILAIDPGSTQSGWAIWDGSEIHGFGKSENNEILRRIRKCRAHRVVIEQVRSYGMAVGETTLDTCEWVGRFHQYAMHHGYVVALMPRVTVKMHLCHMATAKDANIVHALRDRFSYGVRNYGKGTKKEPGFFYGFSKDAWQAFALAVTYWDKEIAG